MTPFSIFWYLFAQNLFFQNLPIGYLFGVVNKKISSLSNFGNMLFHILEFRYIWRFRQSFTFPVDTEWISWYLTLLQVCWIQSRLWSWYKVWFSDPWCTNRKHLDIDATSCKMGVYVPSRRRKWRGENDASSEKS